MIDQSLFKSNVIGKDGFRWWVGQVAPEGVGIWQLALKQGKNNPDAWGNRVKVRIMGYHPFSKKELPDKDLTLGKYNASFKLQEQEVLDLVNQLS